MYPQLFSFSKKMTCLVSQFFAWDDSRSFFLPLSHIAFEQYTKLKAAIAALHLQP
jgi:hypothetical protein